MPPHTPYSIRLSKASARQSICTGQPRQIRLAWFCAFPWTKSASGSASWQATRMLVNMVVSVRSGEWGVAARGGCGREHPVKGGRFPGSVEDGRPPLLGGGRGPLEKCSKVIDDLGQGSVG